MAKIVDYPRAALDSSLQLAEAVSSLGGSCSVDMAADKLGRKVSGSFSALISAAVKYGLVASKDGKLSLQPLYRSIKLAYSDAERKGFLAQAVLSPPLFRAIADRFDGQALPTEHFEKLLVREFDVPEDIASRVAQYFLQGGKQAGLISPSGTVSRALGDEEQADDGSSDRDTDESATGDSQRAGQMQPKSDASQDEFSISFSGPGLNSTIVVREQEDLLIVDAMLKKVSKALRDKEAARE